MGAWATQGSTFLLSDDALGVVFAGLRDALVNLSIASAQMRFREKPAFLGELFSRVEYSNRMPRWRC